MDEIKKCSKLSSDAWSSTKCGKDAVEEIDGKPLCKRHANLYRIRRGLDTGEDLQTRYYVESLSLYKLEGVVTKKYFVVRKKKTLLGDAFFFSTNIDLDAKCLFTDIEAAKNYLVMSINNKVIALRDEIVRLDSRMKKAEAA